MLHRQFLFYFIFIFAFFTSEITFCLDHLVSENEKSSIVANVLNGKIFHSKSIDKKIYPASLTKIMLLYLIYENLDKKLISINDELSSSELAASMQKTNINLKENQTLTVEEALIAVSNISANDASVALAEENFGDVNSCINEMNKMAKHLGMTNTHFANVNGLYHPNNYSSLRDIVKLVVSLKKKYSKYIEKYNNHKMFFRGNIYKSTTDISRYHKNIFFYKTGFVNKSGFNIIINVKGVNFDSIIGLTGLNRSYDRDLVAIGLIHQFIMDQIYDGVIDDFKLHKKDFDRQLILKRAQERYSDLMQNENTDKDLPYGRSVLMLIENLLHSESFQIPFVHYMGSTLYPNALLKSS